MKYELVVIVNYLFEIKIYISILYFKSIKIMVFHRFIILINFFIIHFIFITNLCICDFLFISKHLCLYIIINI